MYTRIQDRSVDEIAARANQYLEGESGAEEFREKLLRAIAHADEDALICVSKPAGSAHLGNYLPHYTNASVRLV